MKNSVDFFLGANTYLGFVSLYDYMYDDTADTAMLIKGGSGTGKSTLMKKIADLAEKENKGLVERIHCSSDPDSLDAVIFRNGRYCIADATAPHIYDPRYPGALDKIVNFGDHWDETSLKRSKAKIMELMRRKKKIYSEIYKCIEAATDAYTEIKKVSEQFVKYDKMTDTVNGIIENYTKNNGIGRDNRRVLYSVTPKGYYGFDSTLSSFADKITVIKDNYGLSDVFMNKLRVQLLSKGYNIYSCKNTVSQSDGTDTIIVPQEKTAFVVSNFLREYTENYTHVIDLKQFTRSSELKSFRARLSFNRKLSVEMLELAAEKLREVRELHEALEKIYISAMDFKTLNYLSNDVIKSFNLA